MRVNRGKDFSFNTVELTGMTDPGAYIAFSGVDYDLYSHGGDIFLTEKDVSSSLPSHVCINRYVNVHMYTVSPCVTSILSAQCHLSVPLPIVHSMSTQCHPSVPLPIVHSMSPQCTPTYCPLNVHLMSPQCTSTYCPLNVTPVYPYLLFTQCHLSVPLPIVHSMST